MGVEGADRWGPLKNVFFMDRYITIKFKVINQSMALSINFA